MKRLRMPKGRAWGGWVVGVWWLAAGGVVVICCLMHGFPSRTPLCSRHDSLVNPPLRSIDRSVAAAEKGAQWSSLSLSLSLSSLYLSSVHALILFQFHFFRFLYIFLLFSLLFPLHLRSIFILNLFLLLRSLLFLSSE